MSTYVAVTGIVTRIDPLSSGSNYGCTILLSVRTSQENEVNFTLTGDTYVVDNFSFNPGERITVFYDQDAPAPLIYPPQYRAVAAAISSYHNYYLGEFNADLVSTDGTIQLNDSAPLNTYLPNGQFYSGALAGHIAMVEYTNSSKSIPALVTPERVFVFCYD